MKHKSLRATIMTSAVLCMSMLCSIAASAAGATEVSTERITNTTTTTAAPTTTPATTTSGATNTSPETTSLPEETSAISGTASTTATTTEETTTTTEFTNPYDSGMLADDDLYKYILDYMGDGAVFDISGAGVLVDESEVTFPQGVTETDESDDEYTDTDTTTEPQAKLMYTVTTRDGSIFYIVIDKNGKGENVYFLNSVDAFDLASIVEKQPTDEEETVSYNIKEQAIINAANGVAVTEAPTEDGQTDEAQQPEQTTDNNSAPTATTSTGSSNTLYIIVGVGVVIAIVIAWYFKVGPGKKNNVGFEDDDEDEEAEEEYYEEDTDEYEEGPVEESYEEE